MIAKTNNHKLTLTLEDDLLEALIASGDRANRDPHRHAHFLLSLVLGTRSLIGYDVHQTGLESWPGCPHRHRQSMQALAIRDDEPKGRLLPFVAPRYEPCVESSTGQKGGRS